MNAMTQVPDTTAAPDPQQIDTYDARDLIKDGIQASIVLDGQVYYLRITRAGKLILTK
ncbi:hemin uptake protein HemP [uncultured Tateyamaria sp.]|uniref:hemin uptake protein HemP n=1 Tax=uncultured Tateyamaria sp. TaxID=455651 RepID=UPI0026148386|nr:hemin uptake protein HemP [uncultured Tateyamaria sp.]